VTRRRPRAALLGARERLRATIGPPASAWVRAGLPPDSWRRWNERHGAAFRVLHGIGSPADEEQVAKGGVEAWVDVPGPPSLDGVYLTPQAAT
jgi:hypothetical protein